MKVVSKIAWCVGGVALLACAGLALQRQNAPTVAGARVSAGAAAPGHAAQPTNADTVAYTPSQFPGVQVRHVPQSAPALPKGVSPAVPGAASIKLRPGAKMPPGGVKLPASVVRQPVAGVRSGRGTTKFGGNWVAMPPERVPLATARRAKNGTVVVDCIKPAASASPASPASH